MIRSRAGIHRSNQRGAVILVIALSMFVILGLTALVVDVGYFLSLRGELQNAADAAALGAVLDLVADNSITGQNKARQTAKILAAKNSDLNENIQLLDSDIVFGIADESGGYPVFVPTTNSPDAIQVFVRREASSPAGAIPTFFGRIFGIDFMEASAEAVASAGKRSIVLVLDRSGSMNYDSLLTGVPWYGAGEKSKSMKKLAKDYKMSTYSMAKKLNYGQKIPDTKGINFYSSTMRQTYEYWNIDEWERIVELLGIDHYDRLNRIVNGGRAVATGVCPGCDLEPMDSTRQAALTFCEVIALQKFNDRIGFVSYATYSRLEEHLTDDFDGEDSRVGRAIVDLYAEGSGIPGYNGLGATNIGNGIRDADHELVKNANTADVRIIVVMTDGRANQPGGESHAIWYAKKRAQDAADNGIYIFTITLGSSADQKTMAEIAAIGNGFHVHAPDREALEEAFVEVAHRLPYRLIK